MTATQEETKAGAAAEDDIKRRLREAIDELQGEALAEVASFVEYQRSKMEKQSEDRPLVGPPHEPVALGGLWAGLGLTTEDLDEARREMWSGFGEREV